MPWRNEDREKFIEENPNYQREYYLKYKDKKLEYQHNYEKENKERLTMHYANRWQKRRIESRNILRNLKVNGCAICGYDKCIDSLDFHHSNPNEKKFKINAMTMTYKIERIVDELNKCILLCKNCHYELHYKERKSKEMERKKNE